MNILNKKRKPKSVFFFGVPDLRFCIHQLYMILQCFNKAIFKSECHFAFYKIL